MVTPASFKIGVDIPSPGLLWLTEDIDMEALGAGAAGLGMAQQLSVLLGSPGSACVLGSGLLSAMYFV